MIGEKFRINGPVDVRGAFPRSAISAVGNNVKPRMDVYGPPWADSESWAEINLSIAYLADRYGRRLAPVFETAGLIRSRLMLLATLLDELCLNTCPHCPEPCCLGAKIWFNTADLLMLHLNRMPVPYAQPLSAWDRICRYAGPGGCRLARPFRPWICTWYLCPPQVARLRKSDEEKQEGFGRAVGEIKRLRMALEEGFIRITS